MFCGKGVGSVRCVDTPLLDTGSKYQYAPHARGGKRGGPARPWGVVRGCRTVTHRSQQRGQHSSRPRADCKGKRREGLAMGTEWWRCGPHHPKMAGPTAASLTARAGARGRPRARGTCTGAEAWRVARTRGGGGGRGRDGGRGMGHGHGQRPSAPPPPAPTPGLPLPPPPPSPSWSCSCHRDHLPVPLPAWPLPRPMPRAPAAAPPRTNERATYSAPPAATSTPLGCPARREVARLSTTHSAPPARGGRRLV